jgi:hypothetical protein
MRVTVLALCLVFVTAGRLRAPPVIQGAVHGEDKAAAKGASKSISKHEPVAEEVVHKNVTKPAANVVGLHAAKQVVQKNVTKSPGKNLTDEEQISNLQNGLKVLANLKPAFTALENISKAPHGDLDNFAQGALSTELASKDSPVWTAIQSMLSVTAETAVNMTGKSLSEREKYMNGLAEVLNEKALILGKVTQKANVVQTQRNDEYLLGVLMQHQKDWSMEQQLNATKKFADTCETAKKLLKSYNKSEPLAPQFAALMDQTNSTTAAKNMTKKAPAVVGEKTAAKMFLQLVSSFDRVRATAKRVTKAPTAAKVARAKAAVNIFLQVVSSFHHVQA